MSKQKVKKPYTIKNFSEEFILGSIVILYITLAIGDALRILEINTIYTRYIPIGIVGFLITYSTIKSGAKKLKKSDKKSLKIMSFIFPIVVAVIMLLYGLYSVNANVESVRTRYSTYNKLLGESGVFSEMFEENITEARNKANLNWLITSVAYLSFAEIGACLITKKLDKFMKEDENELLQQDGKEESQLVVEGDEKLDLTTNNDTVNEPTVNNGIKWDL